ncbi:uncharacterized protein MEPE_03315 [Melanopsichium pennsylvanicum]|uniref:Uncharacterized protein n=2 Tax=Melanopsichium pennsylvanicum TaxID=63383 RepID=A0AAJ4XMF5_9BASI|nr:uncharacterized protein MEPE_03315 [Melanopsichium pennsylvanicum]
MSRSIVLLILISLLAMATSLTSAFDITFPSATNGDYWVACGWNNMTWKSYTTDPRTITIMLTNSNKTLLKYDFGIGNALQGQENAAMVYVPCLPAASGYSLLFVNASNNDHTKKQVLYTSPQFIIKPKNSPPAPASGQSSIASNFQPFFQTPGIVLTPSDKLSSVTNTTLDGDSSNNALPHLDGSADLASFHPVSNDHNAAMMGLVGDLIFVAVIAAFTILIVIT